MDPLLPIYTKTIVIHCGWEIVLERCKCVKNQADTWRICTHTYVRTYIHICTYVSIHIYVGMYVPNVAVIDSTNSFDITFIGVMLS